MVINDIDKRDYQRKNKSDDKVDNWKTFEAFFTKCIISQRHDINHDHQSKKQIENAPKNDVDSFGKMKNMQYESDNAV